MVEPDLATLDVVELVQSLPRRRDGELRRGTARLLRRYEAREIHHCPHNGYCCEKGWCALPAAGGRLVLWAWTPGARRPLTGRLARRRVVLVVELSVRSPWSR